jgi:hypothetical protein
LYNSPANNDTQPASVLPGFGFNGFITSEFEGSSSEAAILLLQELARAQEFGGRKPQEARTQQRTSECSAPLQKLPPSDWRSLGGYFDYGPWSDRDRFMELDRAIAASQRGPAFELETSIEMF